MEPMLGASGWQPMTWFACETCRFSPLKLQLPIQLELYLLLDLPLLHNHTIYTGSLLCPTTASTLFSLAHNHSTHVVLSPPSGYSSCLFIRMPWPSYVWDIFNTVDETTTKEWEYYAPYNILLNYLFPATERFYVSPQHQGLVAPGSIDFSVIYVVHRNQTPIFFLEIKPHSHLNKESTHQAADQQMRG